MFSIDALNAPFADKFLNMRNDCMKRGIVVHPSLGFVNVFLHAEIWKQSRQDRAIDEAIAKLQHEDCPFLATVLMCASTVRSKYKADVLPGFCWHNWGRAADVKLMDRDRLIDILPDDERIELFEDICTENELFLEEHACGFHSCDGFHLQDVSGMVPLDVYMPNEIDREIYRSYRDDNI
jgi:hypothetical protein